MYEYLKFLFENYNKELKVFALNFNSKTKDKKRKKKILLNEYVEAKSQEKIFI